MCDTVSFGLTCRTHTAGERIAHVALVANTDGHVIAHAALRIDPAQARAGVATLALRAGLVWRTVGVDHALGSTVGRGADHFR